MRYTEQTKQDKILKCMEQVPWHIWVLHPRGFLPAGSNEHCVRAHLNNEKSAFSEVSIHLFRSVHPDFSLAIYSVRDYLTFRRCFSFVISESRDY